MHKRLIVAVAAALLLMATLGARAQSDDRDKTDKSRRGPRNNAGMGRGGATTRSDSIGGPPRGRRAPGGRRSPRLATRQETELLAVLKDKRASFYERLIRLRKEDEHAYRRSLNRAWRWYRRWKEMSPEEKVAVKGIEDARLRIGHIMRTLRQTKSMPTAKQRRELLDAITKGFRAEQSLQAIRIEKLGKEIQRLKEELKERSTRHNEIIAERAERILRSTTQPSRRSRRSRRDKPTTQPTK